MSLDTINNKYRPATLEEVIGQDAVVQSLAASIKKANCRAYIFTGPAGTGKTTLGRIVARMVGCPDKAVQEVDAATNSKVEDMRALTEPLKYTSLRAGKARVIIIDEAHVLSLTAWQALLKVVEEPPPGVYWIFCTTEAYKIPKTITTRCTTYALKPVDKDSLRDLVTKVAADEEYEVADDVLDFIVKESEGSPRQALTNLSLCHGCQDRKAAALLLQKHTDSPEAVEICKLLMGNPTWPALMEIVGPLHAAKMDGEGVRRMVLAWMASCSVKAAKTPEKYLAIMEAFSEPYPAQSQMTGVFLSLGKLLCG